MSDLHLEFHADGGASFIASLDPSEVDVLVLAGDIAQGSELPAALGLLCRRFARATIVYVHGNHEFYQSNLPAVHQATREVARRHSNLHWLENRTAKIAGRRFLGATLWFRHARDALPYRRYMNDFFEIEAFESWVYEQNRRTLRWLRRSVRPGDVVVTHHLPTPRAVAPEFVDDPLNPFFVCDVEDVISSQRPALWLYGHTHTSGDLRIGDTRLVCNPLGYLGSAQNGRFDERCCIEI